jgi:hypothetical protein
MATRRGRPARQGRSRSGGSVADLRLPGFVEAAGNDAPPGAMSGGAVRLTGTGRGSPG